MAWMDGSKYIGQWEKGIQHGYGRIILPDKTVKEGYFENNIYRGAIPPAFGLSEYSIYNNNGGENLTKNTSGGYTAYGKIMPPIDLNKIHEKTLNIITKN